MANNSKKGIYIPLWLNIKSEDYQCDDVDNEIYIPLWLNIKSLLIISKSSELNSFTFHSD